MGFSEILVILVLALLVLGPERLPKLAADIGRFIGRARAMARQLSSQLEHEVRLDELVREQNITPAPPAAATPAPMETAPVELTPVATTAEATAINPLESSLAHATPVSQSPVAAPPIVAVDSTVVAPVTKKTASKVAAEPAPLQHSFGLSPPPGPNSTPPPHDAT
jgi:sec-independent protein translocase protein TatB